MDEHILERRPQYAGRPGDLMSFARLRRHVVMRSVKGFVLPYQNKTKARPSPRKDDGKGPAI